MNYTVVIDWKFAVALGAAAVGVVFATKMDFFLQDTWI